MDDAPAYSLPAAFPPRQVLFLILAPLAFFAAAVSSRTRSFMILKLRSANPPPGSEVQAAASPTSVSSLLATTEPANSGDTLDETLLTPDEQNGGALDVDRFNLPTYKVQRSTSTSLLILRILLCSALLPLSLAAVIHVSESLFELVFSVIYTIATAVLTGSAILVFVGRTAEIFGSKNDGSVSFGLVGTRVSGSLHKHTALAITLACGLIFPSLSVTNLLYPLLLLNIVPMGFIPVGIKVHLRKVLTWPLIFLSIISSLVGVIITAVIYFSPEERSTPDTDPTPDPKSSESWWSSMDQTTPFWVVSYPEVQLYFALLPLVQIISILYRYDRNPTSKELEEAVVLKLPPSADLPAPEVGDWMVVLPLHHCIIGRVKALKGVRPHLTYSILAVLVSVISVAIIPVVFSMVLPKAPDFAGGPAARCLGLVLALVAVPPAVFLLAWFRGEAAQLYAYEEDWGAKTVEGEGEASKIVASNV